MFVIDYLLMLDWSVNDLTWLK